MTDTVPPPPQPQKFPSAFHSALGVCLENWQRVEELLFITFWRVSLYTYVRWPATIFTQIRAFDQKCVLVDNVANATLKDYPELLAQWDNLMDKLRKAGKKRHKLVHYAIELTEEKEWRIEPQIFDPRLRFRANAPTPKDKEHYMGMKELENIAESFSDLTEDLQKFFDATKAATDEVRISHAEGFLKQKGLLSKTDNLLKRLGQPPKAGG
jgi:hypothetical protein